MNYHCIEFEVQNAVAYLRLNRPEEMNSFNGPMHNEISDALDAIAHDTSIRVLVLTGRGRAFCAGQDLADAEVQFTPGQQPPDLGEVVERRYKPLVQRLANLRVPTIAAVNGTAAGAGVPVDRIYSERFSSPSLDALDVATRRTFLDASAPASRGSVALHVVLDGKTHDLTMEPEQRILDVALAAGLDLPYSCRGGVCCTCRAKLMDGAVHMDKNFTLEPWETDQGFVLSCQARPTTGQVTLSFDER